MNLFLTTSGGDPEDTQVDALTQRQDDDIATVSGSVKRKARSLQSRRSFYHISSAIFSTSTYKTTIQTLPLSGSAKNTTMVNLVQSDAATEVLTLQGLWGGGVFESEYQLDTLGDWTLLSSVDQVPLFIKAAYLRGRLQEQEDREKCSSHGALQDFANVLQRQSSKEVRQSTRRTATVSMLMAKLERSNP